MPGGGFGYAVEVCCMNPKEANNKLLNTAKAIPISTGSSHCAIVWSIVSAVLDAFGVDPWRRSMSCAHGRWHISAVVVNVFEIECVYMTGEVPALGHIRA
jgi:hypothetical protein